MPGFGSGIFSNNVSRTDSQRWYKCNFNWRRTILVADFLVIKFSFRSRLIMEIMIQIYILGALLAIAFALAIIALKKNS